MRVSTVDSSSFAFLTPIGTTPLHTERKAASWAPGDPLSLSSVVELLEASLDTEGECVSLKDSQGFHKYLLRLARQKLTEVCRVGLREWHIFHTRERTLSAQLSR